MTTQDAASAYQPIFEPPETSEVPRRGSKPLVYCWSKEIKLAVNVALATGRALLLQGEPGVGKSAVAEAVAKHLNWRFYRYAVSSRTEAQDLTWKIDHVRRLADAQAQRPIDEDTNYLVPGPFWWAFDRESAARRGNRHAQTQLTDPSLTTTGEARSSVGAVVLIDEIDKADPAVANDLLEAVGSARFWVDGVNQPFSVEHVAPAEIAKGGLLIVFTSNNERDMPEAFLRRCIVETMAWPSGPADARQAAFNDELRKIARANWDRLSSKGPEKGAPEEELLLNGLIEAIWAQRLAHKQRDRRPPGLAEFLDAISACRELKVTPSAPGQPENSLWGELKRLVWAKDGAPA